jgi:hypothetical protein
MDTSTAKSIEKILTKRIPVSPKQTDHQQLIK